jgi:hypothetical protein
MRVRENVEDDFGRTAQAGAKRRHDERAVDKDRIFEHCIDQLIVCQIQVVEAEFRVGVPFLRIASRTVRLASAIIFTSSPRVGGVLRYSITVGSIPALRIISNVFLDVPKAGVMVDGDVHCQALSF